MAKVRLQLQQADCGWLTLAAGVVAYELCADRDQLLSHGAARYKAARPKLTTAVVLITAFHLLEWLPVWADPYRRLFVWLRRAAPPPPHPPPYADQH